MSGRPSVLLAEDESLIALDIQLSLEDAGFHVVGPCATLDDCFQAVENHDVDYAILDVDLRREPVYPVAEKLNEIGVPIVFHTGHADPRDLTARFPGARVCQKPTSTETLIAQFHHQRATGHVNGARRRTSSADNPL